MTMLEAVRDLFAVGGLATALWAIFQRLRKKVGVDDAPIRVKGGSPVTVRFKGHKWADKGQHLEDKADRWTVAITKADGSQENVPDPVDEVTITVRDTNNDQWTIEGKDKGRGLLKVKPKNGATAKDDELYLGSANSYVATVVVKVGNQQTPFPSTGSYSKQDDVVVEIWPVD